MSADKCKLGFRWLLTVLIGLALLLTSRLGYLFLADPQRFPLNKVKVSASYEHVARTELETILSKYVKHGFFFISIARLKHELVSIPWVEKVDIQRDWPDALNIVIIEKKPYAYWNGLLLTKDGSLFKGNHKRYTQALPNLTGPHNRQQDVLHKYKKLSKLLEYYGLAAYELQLRDNQAWELTLNNGVQLYLGKQDVEKRLERFCRTYRGLFADKSGQLVSVDLRYGRGMAVRWKKQMEK